jgi:hypothetical protein
LLRGVGRVVRQGFNGCSEGEGRSGEFSKSGLDEEEGSILAADRSEVFTEHHRDLRVQILRKQNSSERPLSELGEQPQSSSVDDGAEKLI